MAEGVGRSQADSVMAEPVGLPFDKISEIVFCPAGIQIKVGEKMALFGKAQGTAEAVETMYKAEGLQGNQTQK